MTDTKKAATNQESDLSEKVHFHNIKFHKNNHINTNYHDGRYSRIPTPEKIIESYMSAYYFFKKREQDCETARIWFLCESDSMIKKSEDEDEKKAICANSAEIYLRLAGNATLKKLGVTKND